MGGHFNATLYRHDIAESYAGPGQHAADNGCVSLLSGKCHIAGPIYERPLIRCVIKQPWLPIAAGGDNEMQMARCGVGNCNQARHANVTVTFQDYAPIRFLLRSLERYRKLLDCF